MRLLIAGLAFLLWGVIPVSATDCPGNPNALGTSRVIAVSPTEYPRVGSMQYRGTLPLNDHEVVLTFDDGPSSPSTIRVLDILKAECVQATFFVVGGMAERYPSLVRRAYEDGHSLKIIL